MDKEKIIDRLIEKNFLSVRKSDDEIEYSKEFKECIEKGRQLLKLEIKSPKLFAHINEKNFKNEKKMKRKLIVSLFTWLYFCFENNHDPLKRDLQKNIWDKRYLSESLDDIMGLVATYDTFREQG